MKRETVFDNSVVKYKILAILILLFISSLPASAKDWKSVLDLRGKWKFQLGDETEWAGKSFNDSEWEEIFVPSSWEDDGFPGYDGYAWYRKHFKLPSGAEKKTLYLHLGCIDDVSEVYFNGILVGISGCFPPDFMTAYNTEVILRIPPKSINYEGENVIAVRVYDTQLAGGIVQGKIGIYEPIDFAIPEIALDGMWKFKRGDSEQWKNPEFDDHTWKEIFVPAVWETQDYSNYDGFAWYRLHFDMPKEYAQDELILLLGMIDDLDETYINGEKIGHTGKILRNPWNSNIDGKYQTIRAYTIPSGVLKPGTENIIAVRVFDVEGYGGIYQGPIGIITEEKYRKWKKNRNWEEKVRKGPWEIFDLIFD